MTESDDSGVVRVATVSYSYPGSGASALRDISLTVHAGEIVAVGGESGSGKSTLARLVAGLLRPSVGTVRTAGADTRRVRVQALASRVGLVFQNPNHQLLASSVEDELALGPRNLGASREETARLVGEAAARLDLSGVLDRHPYRLPIAVRKRVAIAAILTMRPRVLVLDEPTTGQSRREVLAIAEVVRQEAERGVGVIVIAHDLRFVSEVAHRLVVLHRGGVAADRAVRDAVGDAALLAACGLEPPPLARLGTALGLAQVPLTIEEAAAALTP